MMGLNLVNLFLSIVISVFIAQISYTQERGIINNSSTAFMNLKTIDIDDCQWTEGFWAQKLQTAYEVMVPNLGRLMEDPEIIHAYENFKVAAGLNDGEFKGWSFHDGDFYKYVEAMAYTYAMTKDEKLDKKMDEIIEVIGKAQRPDGYLCTFIQIGQGVKAFHHESEHKFSKAPAPYSHGPAHEFYNYGHLMTAACVHYRITGKRNFLDIAIKASDNIYEHFKDPTPELARIDWNPPHYMGLVEMYRTTGDKKYLELAEIFVNMLGTAKKQPGDHRGMDHSQRGTPFRQVTEAVGHAGHGNYMYAGVADLYAETGDILLLEALESIWQNVTTRKMYLTGATGPHHFGISNKAIVAESYGIDYEMPNLNAYNETCANIGNAMWNWRMFLFNGDARFADVMELVFYNSALSGISLDGEHFFYTNPMRFIEGHPQNTKDKGERSPFISVFCCPPNIIRTIAKMHTYAYSTSEKGIWVNLYGSNALNTNLADGTNLKLTQESNYPWEGNVKITVDNAEKKGDVIQLELPMEARLISADPNIEETKNQVAVKRGPLVYCLESNDLEEGISINDVVIPQYIELRPRFDANLLGGVTVLEGEAERLQKVDWSNQLYKPLNKQTPGKTNIRLIPYYSWSNRGVNDMTVWMPLGY